MFAFIVRNTIEFIVIFAVFFATIWCIDTLGLPKFGITLLVLVLAWAKTFFFGFENLNQLWEASLRNTAYYRFMLLMLVNMAQIIVSFGCDYFCLHRIDPASFGEINESLHGAELLFEFTYFSVLNFTFFGYGDITPLTIPAKLITMTEILLAFITVIFLLSDFVSLKESLVRKSG